LNGLVENIPITCETPVTNSADLSMVPEAVRAGAQQLGGHWNTPTIGS
jgi:hypothetical protein